MSTRPRTNMNKKKGNLERSYTHLYDARRYIDECSTDDVRMLLKKGIISPRDDVFGETLLSYAASKGKCDIVKLFLRHGSVKNVSKNLKQTALHRAVENGDECTVNALIEGGFSVNAKDVNGTTPLHLAVYRRRVKMVKLLLKKGAKPDVRDISNRAPLYYASVRNFVPIVKLLLENGASAKWKNSPPGETYIHAALLGPPEGRSAPYIGYRGDDAYSVIKLLLEHGAVPVFNSLPRSFRDKRIQNLLNEWREKYKTTVRKSLNTLPRNVQNIIISKTNFGSTQNMYGRTLRSSPKRPRKSPSSS